MHCQRVGKREMRASMLEKWGNRHSIDQIEEWRSPSIVLFLSFNKIVQSCSIHTIHVIAILLCRLFILYCQYALIQYAEQSVDREGRAPFAGNRADTLCLQ
jgi:hypothetical protein